MFIQCEVNGEIFDRYISGSLCNPKQMVSVSTNVMPIPNSDVLITVYPVEDTEVKWRDSFGDIHSLHLTKGKGIAVNKKFIVQ